MCSVAYARIALAVLRWIISAEGGMMQWLTISNIKFGSPVFSAMFTDAWPSYYSGHWFLHGYVVVANIFMYSLPGNSTLLGYAFCTPKVFLHEIQIYYLNDFLPPIIRAMKFFCRSLVG